MTEVTVRRRRGVRILLVGVVIGLAAMWVYVLFIGRASSPNGLIDQSWSQRAEQVCASFVPQIAGLPPAASFADVEPKDEALRQRADVGQQATDLLRAQIAQLRALAPPTGATDGRLLAAWFDDWDTYVADRQAHIEDWRAGNDHAFAETETENGGPITDRMDQLARDNGMDSCVVPQDFG